LAEGEVLTRLFGKLDEDVIGRYSGTSDDPSVQFLEQREAGFSRPAGDERDLKHDEVVGVSHAEKRRRVQEPIARQFVDDLKEVIRGNLQDAQERILDRLGYLTEATFVVSTFKDMNFCEWHLKDSFSGLVVVPHRIGSRAGMATRKQAACHS
jgi:hypothetical protein